VQLRDTESERRSIEIDLRDRDSNYIRMLALDLKMKQYQIEERMLKKVIYDA
jgi:hypothetical protein